MKPESTTETTPTAAEAKPLTPPKYEDLDFYHAPCALHVRWRGFGGIVTQNDPKTHEYPYRMEMYVFDANRIAVPTMSCAVWTADDGIFVFIREITRIIAAFNLPVNQEMVISEQWQKQMKRNREDTP